jgi:hypothetical protein
VAAVAVVAAVIAAVSWAGEPAPGATNPIPPPGFSTPAPHGPRRIRYGGTPCRQPTAPVF